METPETEKNSRHVIVAVGTLGVVYGDIGTSPLYAFRETLRAVAGNGISRGEIIGITSLLIWAIMIIVTLKYVLLLLRIDNNGEGGDLALFARLKRAMGKPQPALILLGIAGAAFFFGDAILTPAISVLSAIEGVTVINPDFQRFVLPVTAGVLTGLFVMQRAGTLSISRWFGPIMGLWFVMLAISGIAAILRAPEVLLALSPLSAILFLADHMGIGMLVLGGIFLAVTGAEALYADLGHFGRKPIQLAWFALVFPALVLNYLGQGALVLDNPATAHNPFFLLVPDAMRGMLVAMATLATIIAAQAVITGAFSVTRQALQLGFLPHMVIRHTSDTQQGQIYIPAINALLLVGVLFLVSEFRSSSALAAAYGISVSASMVITSAMIVLYLHYSRHWRWATSILFILPVFLVELAFFAANLIKLPHGGFVPVLFALALMIVMWSWYRGTKHLFDKSHSQGIALEQFVRSMEKSSAIRVPGLAVFLTSDREHVPTALLHNLKHNKILHERNLMLTVHVANRPYISSEERCVISDINAEFSRLDLYFGFKETPNIAKALNMCRKTGLQFEVMSTSFFLGRRRVVSDGNVGIKRFLDRIYVMARRFSADPVDYFHLPRDRVVEIGARLSV